MCKALQAAMIHFMLLFTYFFAKKRRLARSSVAVGGSHGGLQIDTGGRELENIFYRCK
jgi:hypothetical protein